MILTVIAFALLLNVWLGLLVLAVVLQWRLLCLILRLFGCILFGYLVVLCMQAVLGLGVLLV